MKQRGYVREYTSLSLASCAAKFFGSMIISQSFVLNPDVSFFTGSWVAINLKTVVEQMTSKLVFSIIKFLNTLIIKIQLIPK